MEFPNLQWEKENKMSSKPPPGFAQWIVRRLSKYETRYSLDGDLRETYESISNKKEYSKAYLWYWSQTIKAFCAYFILNARSSFSMIGNYIKIVLRNIRRHKGYSFINIFGLAVGFACSMLIGLFVAHELSYDRFHINAHRIYRIAMRDDVSTPPPLARTLAADFPEIEYATCFSNLRIQPVKYGDHLFYESPVRGTTNDCFQMFSFPFLLGDKETALIEPNTVVLTKSMAEKYFGDEDPLFKSITIGNEDYRVDGVIEDVPENAHFDFRCLVSNSSFRWYLENRWGTSFMSTYVMLRDPSDIGLFESKLPDFVTKYIYGGDPNHERLFITQPLTSIHLHSHLRFELGTNGDFKNIIIFTTAAIFMIIIACINFTNLTTAKSFVRFREIGIRKTVGSIRGQILCQLLSESVLMSLLAFLVAVSLVLLSMPMFPLLIGQSIGLSNINLSIILPCLMGFVIIVGFIAGMYPALFLSSVRPAHAVKGVFHTGKSMAFRSGLVVFQFVMSISLIIGTLTVYRQLDLIHSRDLGFEKDQMLIIKNLRPDPLKSETLKQRLLQHPDVSAVSASGNLPGKGNGRNWLVTESADTLLLNMYFCDFDYQETLQLKMAEGRFFSRRFATDTAGLILNAHTVKAYGIEDPVGKRITFYYGRPIPLTIIGIVDDFHYESLHYQIRSLGMVYGIDKGWGINFISIRFHTEDIGGMVRFIEKTWKEVNPSLPFDYSFMDDEFGRLHANEQRTGKVAAIFCILAIAVSCLGLFGLSHFMIERRVKEIGIRKVMGASIGSAVWLLSRNFISWVILSFILATPLAVLVMNRWLQNFAYRVSLDAWVFLFSGLLTLMIAFFTVSIRALKAALANPVESLRYE
jgi:putative ABC transport system permease protein